MIRRAAATFRFRFSTRSFQRAKQKKNKMFTADRDLRKSRDVAFDVSNASMPVTGAPVAASEIFSKNKTPSAKKPPDFLHV
jgi:hypothetical protein